MSDKCREYKDRRWWYKVLLLIFTIHYSLFTIAQVGTWRNYLAYHDVQNICAADHYLFILASNGLYQYNQNDQSIITYDLVNGLSDNYITHIAWNQKVKRLIAVYENSNIDLIDTDGNIINISALYNKAMTQDKAVTKITIDDVYAYLHCGFGLVKVNMQKAELSDTYTPNHPEYPTNLPEYNEYQNLENYKSTVTTLNPGGPKYNYFYEMKFINNQLFATGGEYSSYNQKDLDGCIQVLKDNEWQIYQENIKEMTGTEYKDIDCIDIDPLDNNHVFAGGRTGLYEFKNGQLINYYNKDNSPLKPAYSRGNYLDNYIIIKGLKFDSSGNLWVINNHSDKTSLFKLTTDKKWVNLDNKLFYDSQTGVSMHGMRNIIIDSRGLLWWVNDHWYSTSCICYNPETEQPIIYNTFVNQDGTKYEPTAVTCVKEDLEGNIWIGTNLGPFYIDKAEIGNQNVTFQQVKVPRNDGTNYADYLLSGSSINSIAIDPGNRKWFGTSDNGAYLISADNIEQINHFTVSNSYILSDIIKYIEINKTNGEVYFATQSGLCSYMSDATNTSDEMTKDNVYAYPNPVTPDYNGLITILGLSYDADVKITSSNGALIAEGRSNGGTFTWDGCDRKGNRVVSGIYMVITATSEGKKGTVCKIAIIR